jgi:hypothetical protein
MLSHGKIRLMHTVRELDVVSYVARFCKRFFTCCVVAPRSHSYTQLNSAKHSYISTHSYTQLHTATQLRSYAQPHRYTGINSV